MESESVKQINDVISASIRNTSALLKMCREEVTSTQESELFLMRSLMLQSLLELTVQLRVLKLLSKADENKLVRLERYWNSFWYPRHFIRNFQDVLRGPMYLRESITIASHLGYEVLHSVQRDTRKRSGYKISVRCVPYKK